MEHRVRIVSKVPDLLSGSYRIGLHCNFSEVDDQKVAYTGCVRESSEAVFLACINLGHLVVINEARPLPGLDGKEKRWYCAEMFVKWNVEVPKPKQTTPCRKCENLRGDRCGLSLVASIDSCPGFIFDGREGK